MPRLLCSLSKEVREEGKGRSASVTLEVELDADTLRSPGRLKQHIRCGFDRIRESIEEELARAEPRKDLAGDGTNECTVPRRFRGNGQDRPATRSQLRLLRVLAGRGERDLTTLIRDRCGKAEMTELTLAEASGLIDELGGTADNRRR